MVYRFYDEHSSLHDTHLEGVSGSHWGEEQLRDFRVSFEVVKPPSEAILPSLNEYRLDDIRNLLKHKMEDREDFSRLREFVYAVKGDLSLNPSKYHPIDFLRQGGPGAQFYHDLAVACLRNLNYTLEDPETPEKRGPSTRSVNPPARLQEFVTNFDDFSPLSAEISRAPEEEEASQTASFRPATVTDSAEYDDLPGLLKPETVTQALAKSFIETVIALRPLNLSDSVNVNTRLSFLVSQNTFRLNLPSVHCTIINDGGVVFTRHNANTHGRQGGDPSATDTKSYTSNRVLLSLEAKAKQRQPRPISGITIPTADKAILAQQCAELIGQALSDPELDAVSERKTYYLISLSGCAITFISATFTPQYVAYLKSSCTNCRGRSNTTNTRPPLNNHNHHESQATGTTTTTTRTHIIDNAINPPNLYLQGQTTPEQAATPYPIGSSSPVMASSPAAEYATRHPTTTTVAPPITPSAVKRSHSNLSTDDEEEESGTRRTKEFVESNGEDYNRANSISPDVFLQVVRSKEFLLTNASGRLDATIHLVAILEQLEEETGCYF